MAPRRTAVLVSVALLFAGIETSVGNAQESPAPVKAVQLLGLTGVKQNAKGTLKVENGNLQFVHGKTNADITAASIQDIVTGDDTQRSVGGAVGVMSMAAPYGGGRFLSLFRKKIDTLTIQYRDVGGALHGAIFTMPVGAASAIQTELVSGGAIPQLQDNRPQTPSPARSKTPYSSRNTCPARLTRRQSKSR